MSKNLPATAIDVLNKDAKPKPFVNYATVCIILFITFAIPVTITQVYNVNIFSSSAQTSFGSGMSTIVPTLTPTSQPTSIFNSSLVTQYLLPYWWLVLIGLGLLALWVSLIIIFIKERAHPSYT